MNYRTAKMHVLYALHQCCADIDGIHQVLEDEGSEVFGTDDAARLQAAAEELCAELRRRIDPALAARLGWF